MGSTYKTDFNVFNGTDYDRHYFSTTADQVSVPGSTDLATYLNYFLLHCVDIQRGTTTQSVSTGLSTLSYRSGFTRLNTCVLCAMTYDNDGVCQLNGTPPITVKLRENNILVETTPGMVDFVVVLFRTDRTVPDGEFVIGNLTP